MPTTINTGLVDEVDILQAQRPVDMSPKIDMLDPDETQFFTMLNKLPKGDPPINTKVDWLMDTLLPRRSALSTSITSTVSSLSVTASESPYFRAGDVCRLVYSGEAFVVVGNGTTSASILEVTRGLGDVAAATAPSATEVVIVGNASVQGASLGTRLITKKSTNYNYTQIFRSPYGFVNTLIASRQYGGPVLDFERRKKLVEHKIEIENSLFWGARDYDSTTNTEPQTYMGGLVEYISTNSHNAAGTYAYTTLEGHLRQDLEHGSQNKVVFAAPVVTQVFSSYSLTAWTRATPEQSVWGVHVDGLLSGAYGWGVPVFVKRDWNRYDVSTNGGYGSQAFIVDMEAVRIRVMPGRQTQLLRNRQGNSQDQIVEEYLTEMTLQVETENKHARIYNVTG